jgi:hypothetical protein
VDGQAPVPLLSSISLHYPIPHLDSRIAYETGVTLVLSLCPFDEVLCWPDLRELPSKNSIWTIASGFRCFIHHSIWEWNSTIVLKIDETLSDISAAGDYISELCILSGVEESDELQHELLE